MSAASLYVSLLILSAYSTCRAEGGDMCGSINVSGPFDEHGNSSTITTLLPLYVNGTASMVISCRVETNQSLDGFIPRLRFYLTRNGYICTLRSGTGSYRDINTTKACEGFHYDYNQTRGTNMIKFIYYVTPIAGMDQSVATCGVIHYRTGAQCFGQLAALISFQDGATCGHRPANTTTNKMSTTTEFPKSTESPATTQPSITTKPPTTVRPSMTTKIPNTETASDTPVSTADTTSDIPVPTADTIISVKQDTFFSGIAVIILVGIILVAANFIQLWVIIKIRRAAPAAPAIDEHGIEFNEHRIEIHQHGNVEEPSTMIENSMAKESG